MAPAIRCAELVKEYHAQKTVRALEFVDLKVEEGEVFGLLGPNGAGKTTLVRILATLLRATHGRAWVGGYDVIQDEQQVRRIIGYAGQDSERSAYFRLTVRENMLYFAHALRGVPLRTARERIAEVAAGVGFADQLDKQFITLSGGQKQRTSIARAVMRQPKILILDDALSSVDTYTEEEILHRLRAVMRGRTSLIISHRISTVKDADQIIVLHDRRIVEQGTHDELVARGGIYAELYRKQLLEEELEKL